LYHVEILVQSLDLDFRRVVSALKAQATLTALPLNSMVEIRVIASNDTGESLPSTTLIVHVPAMTATA
jgi:hypothetical protein